jgi:hypothetical protein
MLMTGHQHPLNERGWRVPRQGTRSWRIYQIMLTGASPADIWKAVGGSRSSVGVLAWKIRHPAEANASTAYHRWTLTPLLAVGVLVGMFCPSHASERLSLDQYFAKHGTPPMAYTDEMPKHRHARRPRSAPETAVHASIVRTATELPDPAFIASLICPEAIQCLEIHDQDELTAMDMVAPWIEAAEDYNMIDDAADPLPPAPTPPPPLVPVGYAPLALVIMLAAMVGIPFWRNRRV